MVEASPARLKTGGCSVLTDARSIAADSTLQADICIVGAGIAGISIAREFIGRSESVVLLEGGGLEFTKSLRDLLALVVVCVGIGALACVGTASHPQGVTPANFDATQQSLAGLYLGQLVIAVLGALTITSEYSTGMIRTSLSVQPRRGVVFAAKAVVFAAVTMVIG